MKTRWIMLSKYFPPVAPISNVNHDSGLNFSEKKNLQFKGVHLKKKTKWPNNLFSPLDRTKFKLSHHLTRLNGAGLDFFRKKTHQSPPGGTWCLFSQTMDELDVLVERKPVSVDFWPVRRGRFSFLAGTPVGGNLLPFLMNQPSENCPAISLKRPAQLKEN